MSLLDHIDGWHPPARSRTERLTAEPARNLARLLDQPWPTQHDHDLPPLWHWLYFLDHLSQSELGADGHPRDGEFLPPIPHRRRMFAGGRLTILHPLRIDDQVTKRSTLHNAAPKQGSKSELLFITVRHELTVNGRLHAVEESDLVYRSEDTTSPAATTAVADDPAPASGAPWQFRPAVDPVLLFRFSALTANAHRIHYDETHTRNVEGFPGLVVHGPLLALLLLELPRRFAPQGSVASFEFRARRPVFAGQPFVVHGNPDGGDNWSLGIDTGSVSGAMTGKVRLQ